MIDPMEQERPGRRRFLMLMGLAGFSSAFAGQRLAMAGVPGGEAAPAGGGSAGKPSSSTPEPKPTQPAAEEKPVSPEARSLAEIVRLRHGENLTDEQIGRIAQKIDDRLEYGRKLAGLTLANADEPDFGFKA